MRRWDSRDDMPNRKKSNEEKGSLATYTDTRSESPILCNTRTTLRLPLEGKLSPEGTDEVVTAEGFPPHPALTRHLLLKEKASHTLMR